MSLLKNKASSRQYKITILLIIIFSLVGLAASIGCSLGALIVQVPTPTSTPFKTPQPTFTFTPNWTPTFTPSATPTVTDTPTPTNTPTPIPTQNPEAGENEEEPPPEPVAEVPAEPVVPPDTPTPEGPTETPAPTYPFTNVPHPYDTGSPGETRLTAWVVRVYDEPGKFKTLSGYRMRVLAPDGNTYFSEVSGSGFADSTVPGAGDNNRMNTKLEIRPYTPGVYKIALVDETDAQVSPEIEVNFSAEPLKYIHFDFYKRTDE